MVTTTRDSSIEIAASVDKLWGIFADDFTDISAWVDVVKTSGPNPATPNGVNGSRHGGRICDIEGLGLLDERIFAYDADAHSLSYTAQSPNHPPFLERLANTWSFHSIGDNRSRVDIHVEVTTTGDDTPDSEPMKFAESIAEIVAGASQNLKTYVESNI